MMHEQCRGENRRGDNRSCRPVGVSVREHCDQYDDNQRRKCKRQQDSACRHFFRRTDLSCCIKKGRKNDRPKNCKLGREELECRERVYAKPLISLNDAGNVSECDKIMLQNPNQVWCRNDCGYCKRQPDERTLEQ